MQNAIGPETVGQRVQTLLQTDAVALVIGTVILTVAISAVAVHAARRKSAERLLLWFGLFAGLYGLRLLLKTSLAHLVFGGSEQSWRFAEASLNYFILVPAVLSFEEVYGRGWKSWVRLLVWVFASYGILAVAAGVIGREPFIAPDPASGLLIALPVLLLVDRVLGYRQRSRENAATYYTGLTVFVLTVLNEHLVQWHIVPWQSRVEPTGFLFFLGCMGYAGARRFVANEQELISIDQEMKAATRIQRSILPREIPAMDGIRLSVRYMPMTAVAGDFYDFVRPSPNCLGVLVADVAGHGVPAALVASMLKVAISSQAASAADPGCVISGLNQVMCSQVQGQLTTAAYLFVDGKRRRARYSSAGHPPLLLSRAASSRVQKLTANGLLLGVRPAEIYSNLELVLEPGDRFILYTDGVTEAVSASGEFFGEERFLEFIAAHRNTTGDDSCDALLRELSSWSMSGRRSVQADDITVVVIDVLPGAN